MSSAKKTRPAAKKTGSWANDIDGGVPRELSAQFAPDAPETAGNEFEAQVWPELREIRELRAREDPGAQLSDDLLARFDHKVSAWMADRDVMAWWRLHHFLYEAQRDKHIAASSQVESLVSALMNLVADAPAYGGTAGIFKRMSRAFAAKAATARRNEGEASREEVLRYWEADVAAGGAERGRCARIARKMTITPRAVRFVVAALQHSGRLNRGAKAPKGS